MLEHRVGAVDIDPLVLTRVRAAHVRRRSLTEAEIGTQRVVNGLVDVEIRQRPEDLQEPSRIWISRSAGDRRTTYTVADTSVYIEHDDKLRDLDFTALLDSWPDKPVVVLVPLIILDELDGLKQRGGDALAALGLPGDPVHA